MPFFGSLPFMDVSKGFISWGLDPRVTAHPLAFVKIGGMQINANVTNDFNLAKEFDKEEFSGKDPNKLILASKFFKNAPQDVIFTEGFKWSAHRRFSLKTLKDFGFDGKSIEGSNHEVDKMMEIRISSQVTTTFSLDTSSTFPS